MTADLIPFRRDLNDASVCFNAGSNREYFFNISSQNTHISNCVSLLHSVFMSKWDYFVFTLTGYRRKQKEWWQSVLCILLKLIIYWICYWISPFCLTVPAHGGMMGWNLWASKWQHWFLCEICLVVLSRKSKGDQFTQNQSSLTYYYCWSLGCYIHCLCYTLIKKGTQFVTGVVPFRCTLQVLICTNMHSLGVNKVYLFKGNAPVTAFVPFLQRVCYELSLNSVHYKITLWCCML